MRSAKLAPGTCAFLVALLLLVLSGCAREPQWNVVLVTFDTTRADRIGDYGEGNHTPNLDRLAADGARFANAYTAVPITAPSHSTMLTGKYPLAHGVRDNGLFVLGEEQHTLAEVLGAAGYGTAGAIGSFPLLGRFGFAQGFDLFDDDLSATLENFLGVQTGQKDALFFEDRPAAQVNAAVLPWLRDNAARPFFLWTHYFDPHLPHRPRPPYDQLFIGDSYRAEIAYADESFGALVDELKSLGVWDHTLLIFTSDHGEGLGEHLEETHSMLLYNATLQVPMIVHVPGMDGGRVIEERVGTVDIMPTVLDLLGLDAPEDLQGRSLAPLLLRNEPLGERSLYAETLSPRLSNRWGELRALIEGDEKYIFGPVPELFDLESDPKELEDLLEARGDTADRMQRRLATFIRDNAVEGLAAPGEIDQETRDRLQALGYLSGSDVNNEPIQDRLNPEGEPPQERVVDISRMSTVKNLLYAGEASAARPLIHQLLAGSPESPYYLELLAVAELSLGNEEDGLRIIRQIRDLHSNKEALARHALRGAEILLVNQGGVETAEQLAAESLDLFPTAMAQYVHALTLQQLGRFDDYLAGLRAALELDPELIAARLSLALELIRRGDIDSGEASLRRAMADYPFHAESFYYYARLAFETGRTQEAVNNYRRAIELEPSFLQARQALVRVLVRQGMLSTAREEVEELERLAPNSKQATRARGFLEGRR